MATITPVGLSNAGSKPSWAAITTGGDVVANAPGKTVVIEFDNQHNASITVAIAPTQTTAQVDGVGSVTVPTRSVVAATTEPAVFKFKEGEKAAYLNASGQFPITYTDGNTAMKVRAFYID
ncbi:hypothetical protein [Prosthecomicrobium hirschii]|uniref:hypothetical protein n=1 Tax=Prosthecodimorpha hirschii TaxID=665126 RepID=UPI0022203A0F|nr:hypothetical protein [Prosthecomicrobium hirschii]MCW1844133.1 hypothetical protein [Prosthecomicrobium hirschii]